MWGSLFVDSWLTFVDRMVVLQNALDKNGKTALDLCENVNQRDWQSAASLLRSAMSRPVLFAVPALSMSFTINNTKSLCTVSLLIFTIGPSLKVNSGCICHSGHMTMEWGGRGGVSAACAASSWTDSQIDRCRIYRCLQWWGLRVLSHHAAKQSDGL